MLQLSLNFLERQLGRIRLRMESPSPRTHIDRDFVWKDGMIVRIVFRPRAKRYLVGLRSDGMPRLVIPRRGTETEGLRFLERSETWLRKRLAQHCSRSVARQNWSDGARLLFRGEEVELRAVFEDGKGRLCFADQAIPLAQPMPDYREPVLAHLRALAERELPLRTRELALAHGITVHRVSVRGQKTRWGSCSARGTISLNWRLIQAPAFVVDYLIIHELMHRREMNHSARFWRRVAEAYPDYCRAEQWLKRTRIGEADGVVMISPG